MFNYAGSYDYLAPVEFAYQNSCHTSVGITPFEVFYAWRYRRPVCCDEVGEREPTKVG